MTKAGPGSTSAARTPSRRRTAANQQARQKAKQRELRWKHERLAVPYLVDGPKVTLGVLWFVALVGAAYYWPRAVVPLLTGVAGVAALQAGHAWSKQELSDRWVAAVVAALVAASAWFGAFGLGVMLVVAAVGLGIYAWTVNSTTPEARARFADVLARASLPAGAAAGGLAVLALDRTPAFVSIVLLVSCYEIGDFLVGSGSANAVEGPLAGLVAMALAACGLFLVLPEPFTEITLPLFVGVAALGAPLGQIAASALLPRGDAWAPALRRLDSYLISSPIWALLV